MSAATLELVNASGDDELPSSRQFAAWIAAALAERPSAQVDLRIVDENEGRSLNLQYRGRDYATNVLAFPCEFPDEAASPLLGDLVLCAPVVRREACEQRKAQDAHWAHLVVHGCLHLLGYDHEDEADAARMESREAELLAALGFPDPYLVDEAVP
jgi:probable rRNA maturation factor